MSVMELDVKAVHDAVDWDIFSRYTMHDKSLQKDVILIFKSHSRQYISDLKYAKNVEAWRLAAHTLKGTARTLGAQNLDKLACTVEQMDLVIENDIHDNLAETRVDLRVIIQELEAEIKRINQRFAEVM